MLNMWFGFGGWVVVMAFYMPLDVKNCAMYLWFGAEKPEKAW